MRGLATAALSLTTVLSACTLAPHYSRPEAPVAAAWTGGSEDSAHAAAAQTGWRQFFPDPGMQKLIELALANNRDLRVAALNVQQAQAQYRVQRADLFPSIAAIGLEEIEKYPSGTSSALGTGSTTTGTTSGATATSTGGQTIRFYEAGVGFTSYEVDFFGRIRSLNRAALERYLGVEETRRSTQISLIAEVVSAYLAVVADETILKVTRDTLQSQSATYELTKRSLDAGTTTALAFRQAALTVDTAKGNLAAYTRQAAQDRNALVLLLGTSLPPDVSFDADLGNINLSADLPAGIPSQTLANRPDVLAAEHELVAANANIGAARAAFFPSISLTGQFGTASTQLSGLFKSGSAAWTFSPQISLPIFTGGANKANLDLSKVEKNIDIAQYEKTLQTAFREVDDALASRQTLDDQLAAERAALEDSSQAYHLADLRFRSGVDSFLPVLDAQRTLYSSQQSLIALQLQRLQNMATLYKALGGGLIENTASPPPAQ